MGFFGKLFGGLSRAASAVVKTTTKIVEKTVEIATAAAEAFAEATIDATIWAVDKLSGSRYDSNSVDSRKGVEQALADFRSEISEKAEAAEETSIYSALSKFDEFVEVLEESFPELVSLVRTRQSETEDLLRHTIINYVQEHISENDPYFQSILKMEPGHEKKEKLANQMQQIIDDAQNYFGSQLKKHIELLNDELNVRLNQKIEAQERVLKERERKYQLYSDQQTSKTLDIQKVEEECVPLAEAAACIQELLAQEEKDELLVSHRSSRSKRNRKSR